MTTKTQKNDRLKQNRIQWRLKKIHHPIGECLSFEAEVGLRRPIIPDKRGLSNSEIKAIFRWEDDGGRTH